MTEHQQQKHLRIGRYAFWSSLIGAVVFLVGAVGMRLTPTDPAQQVLAWSALIGSMMLFGGLVIYLVWVAVVTVRRRVAPTPEDDVTQDRR